MKRKIREKGKEIRGIAGLLTAAFLLAGCGWAGQESDSGQSQEQAASAEPLKEREKEENDETINGGTGTDEGSGDAETVVSGWSSQENAAGQSDGNPEEDISGDQDEITIIMVGDILLHTPVAESGRLEEGGYDFSAIFSEMKEEISEADLALVNQEVIIGGEELGISGYPAFNAPYELGDALAEAGFDVVLHATNHALDKGKQGILNCLSFWQENYPEMAVLGIHESQESGQEIYLYEQDGIRIAVLNYTYGTNGIPLPEDMPWAVDMLEKDRVSADLARARELADFVIVCPHWGTEYRLEASQEQEYWAELMAQNGADLVLGTHPHVIEPVEWMENGGDAGTLVYYSLGNFVNWTAGTGEGVANRMVGAMAKVTLGRDEKGKVGIRSYEALPLVCHVEKGFGGVRVYPLASYPEELAQKNEIAEQDGNFSLEYCRNLVKEVFGITSE